MMEEIKAAEKAAEETRTTATADGRNLVRDAELSAKAEADAMVVQARNTAKTTIATAEEAAKVKASALVKERAEADKAVVEAATAKMEDAVAYIMEKVVV